MSYRRLFSGVSIAALAPDLATNAGIRINAENAAVLIANDIRCRRARGNSRLAVVYAGHLIRAGRVARGQGDRACDQYQQSHGVSFCGHPVILDTRNFVQPYGKSLNCVRNALTASLLTTRYGVICRQMAAMLRWLLTDHLH